MTKYEAIEIINYSLEHSDSAYKRLLQHLCNWFNADELVEFAKHIVDEEVCNG